MPAKSVSLFCVALLLTTSAAAQWKYSTRNDPMGGPPQRIASVQSTNFHQLPFPYQGKTFATLSLRYTSDSDIDVLLQLDRGQITCSSNCEIRMRFDDTDITGFFGSFPSDHSTDAVFLDYEEGFVKRALEHKLARVELVLFQAGTRVFEFRLSNLQWPPSLTAPKRR